MPQAIANAPSFADKRSKASSDPTERTTVAATDRSLGGVSGRLRYSVMYDVNQWLAIEERTDMFGEGDTPDDALHDLFESLRELRGHLEYYEAHLSNSQVEKLSLLRRR